MIPATSTAADVTPVRPRVGLLAGSVVALAVALACLAVGGTVPHLVGWFSATCVNVLFVALYRSTDSRLRGDPYYSRPLWLDSLHVDGATWFLLLAGFLIGAANVYPVALEVARQ